MNEFLTFISMSVLVEALISWVDAFATADNRARIKLGASILAGLALSIMYGLDLMKMLGYDTAYPIIGSVVTGLIVARGSNYFFDLIGRLTNTGNGKTVVSTPSDSTVLIEPTDK